MYSKVIGRSMVHAVDNCVCHMDALGYESAARLRIHCSIAISAKAG